MLRTFIQVLALTLSLISAYFLIAGALHLSIDSIVEISRSKWNYNLNVAQNYCHYRADYIVGFALLLLSFSFQMGNLLWAMRINDYGLNKAGVIIALSISVIALAIAFMVSNHLYDIHYRQIESMLKKIK